MSASKSLVIGANGGTGVELVGTSLSPPFLKDPLLCQNVAEIAQLAASGMQVVAGLRDVGGASARLRDLSESSQGRVVLVQFDVEKLSKSNVDDAKEALDLLSGVQTVYFAASAKGYKKAMAVDVREPVFTVNKSSLVISPTH